MTLEQTRETLAFMLFVIAEEGLYISAGFQL